MVRIGARHVRIGCSALAVAAACLAFAPLPRAASDTLPARLSDQEFWKISEDCSEPNGYFQSDNLVGNERQLQFPVPALRKMTRGGVYLGVAPDQNFTYILALVIDKTIGLRVTEEEEYVGLDISQHAERC